MPYLLPKTHYQFCLLGFRPQTAVVLSRILPHNIAMLLEQMLLMLHLEACTTLFNISATASIFFTHTIQYIILSVEYVFKLGLF